jgi:RHS repeat-associated protein
VAVLAKIGNTLKLHYIEADALGTPRAVIDPVRNVAVWRWDLTDEAFGESEPSVDPDNDGHWFVFDMRYPGQQYDSVSGLNYNYFRDYDPSTGRYVQSDPIGLAGGISTYGYVYGNPNGYIDPLGLDGGGIYTNPNTRMAPPRAVNPRDLQDAGLALDIMMPLANEMKKRKIPNVDQFYHCLAACRAVHATGNKSMVIEVMNTKEATDWWRWRFGIYAKHFDSSSQMRADNASDQAVNEYGASCMPGENCVKRCRKYLDMIPAARRPEMADYVPEWTLKRSAK